MSRGNTAMARKSSKDILREFCYDPLIYSYDGSLEGLFSAIFESYSRHENPAEVCPAANLQTSLLYQVVDVETNMDYAVRVRDKLLSCFGEQEYERIKMAYLSDDPVKDTVICHYVRHLMRTGKAGMYDAAHPDTAAFAMVWRPVFNERHRMLQFLRFSLMEGGVYFARINPNANVVPLIMEHFKNRFNDQPFLIYDEVHHIAGLYDLHDVQLISTDEINLPDLADAEREWREMWRTFYDAICNQQRLNPALRRSFMPKRLWGNLTELNRVDPVPLGTQQATS
ncbi:MAG: TIGR03915 family putative DNA repair protein [Coriobacteriales bacterium]|nr:TIGR03915 family putative DNA repair protein [Coriobacteriales bacterium]